MIIVKQEAYGLLFERVCILLYSLLDRLKSRCARDFIFFEKILKNILTW